MVEPLHRPQLFLTKTRLHNHSITKGVKYTKEAAARLASFTVLIPFERLKTLEGVLLPPFRDSVDSLKEWFDSQMWKIKYITQHGQTKMVLKHLYP